MKKLLIAACLLATFTATQGQIGWGTTTPNTSAALDISSTTKGVLLPRMSTSVRTGITGVNGLLVFDTDTNTYWYYNNTIWVEIVYSFERGTVGMIAAFASATLPANWKALDGSSLTAASYPDLVAVYPGWVSGANIVLPDYRGYFLRGTGTHANGTAGAAIGAKQTDATALPVNPFVVATAGASAHPGSVTNSAGVHSHTFQDYGDGSVNVEESSLANDIADNNGATRTTSASSIGDHTHTVSGVISSAGDHTHTVTGGDTETRPRNISIVWAVKIKS